MPSLRYVASIGLVVLLIGSFMNSHDPSMGVALTDTHVVSVPSSMAPDAVAMSAKQAAMAWVAEQRIPGGREATITKAMMMWSS
jgi:hypothetical protein